MIDLDGWETVYATGDRMLREETDAEFRERIRAFRREPRFSDVPTFMRRLVRTEAFQVITPDRPAYRPPDYVPPPDLNFKSWHER